MATGLVELEVLGVRRQSSVDQVVVLLLDAAGRRLLPVVVGPAEGAAIAAGQAGIVPPRPMTHDLLVSVLETCGVGVAQVEIVSLEDGVFHAALVLDTGDRVDSRASDGVALAVRLGCPVLCVSEVLDESALEVEGVTPEDEVEEFKAFLENVTPEDFENAPPEGPVEPG
ncbi:bifunctional nuclease family protein [Actinotalea sp. M2MS4P-6]|uniref:bifunctional nuclease family protein n=1 Tax=Actinotalea sp. M2MS4P-6 TaxID=2983762 RepID=UPI0021E3EB72|nr:bifunctional nuclease family protein [Actinotalea sp. M2MS4P-6]MCV2394628.1 bifunctional nuclease family protein [Actinotalea sp. M2MS4P-6]